MAKGIPGPPFTPDDVLDFMAWSVVNKFHMPERRELYARFACNPNRVHAAINELREAGVLDPMKKSHCLYAVRDKVRFRKLMLKHMGEPVPEPPPCVETKESRAGAKRYDRLIASFSRRVGRH